jgi:RNA recognition motif-containing protein
MAKKIFVGSVAWATTNDSLKSAFSQYGEVESAEILTDKMTGRSRGFGFVVMPNDDEAQAAIDGLNGQALDGRNIVVNEARPREERAPRRDFQSRR